MTTQSQVRRVPVTTQSTDTFRPISHGRALDLLFEGLDRAGLKTVDDGNFTLANEGARMFGTFQLANKINPDVGLMLGLTNSFDKSLAMKVGFGSHVFVCSNGCFFAEKILGRKHSKNIDNDIEALIDSALADTPTYLNAQKDFIETLRNVELDPAKVNDMTVRLWRDAKAITKGEILDVIDEFERPSHDVFAAPTAWSYHNAVTEIGKRIAGKNGIAHSERMIGLTTFLQGEFSDQIEERKAIAALN